MKAIRLALVLSFVSLAVLTAEDYRAVVPQLSPATVETYRALTVAVVEATGNKVDVQTVPFARFQYMIETKQADFGTTIIQIPDQRKWNTLTFDYSQTETVDVVFVLYTNPSKPIDVAALKNGNPQGYVIETDTAHVDYFSFTAAPSTSIAASLKKVDAGTIDGYLFAQPSTDAALKSLGLKNIRRAYFDTLTGVFILPKDTRGGTVDRMLADGMAKIRANGTYDRLMAQYIQGASSYIDWQP